MRVLLSLLQLFNLCDWVIALFIAGSASRIDTRVVIREDGTLERVDGRPLIAIGISLFCYWFAFNRLGEFFNLIVYGENLGACLGLLPQGFSVALVLFGFSKTLALLFLWFVVNMEQRQRKGILSGNVIRAALARLLNRLR